MAWPESDLIALHNISADAIKTAMKSKLFGEVTIIDGERHYTPRQAGIVVACSSTDRMIEKFDAMHGMVDRLVEKLMHERLDNKTL